MKYANVPCPKCGGLVREKPLSCTKCRAAWDGLTDLIYDGLTEMSDRAVINCESVEWETLEDAQPFWNMLGLHSRYEKELERLERTL